MALPGPPPFRLTFASLWGRYSQCRVRRTRPCECFAIGSAGGCPTPRACHRLLAKQNAMAAAQRLVGLDGHQICARIPGPRVAAGRLSPRCCHVLDLGRAQSLRARCRAAVCRGVGCEKRRRTAAALRPAFAEGTHRAGSQAHAPMGGAQRCPLRHSPGAGSAPLARPATHRGSAVPTIAAVCGKAGAQRLNLPTSLRLDAGRRDDGPPPVNLSFVVATQRLRRLLFRRHDLQPQIGKAPA